MKRKAQVSQEFFILVGIGFLLSIAIAIMSLDQLQDFRNQQEDDVIKDIALRLQKEVLIAVSVEDGYTRKFNMPEKIESLNYTIRTLNISLIVSSNKSFYITSIPEHIGNLTKGNNTINKTGGVVYIN